MPLHLITSQQQIKDCLDYCDFGDAIVLMNEAATLATIAVLTASKTSHIEIYQLAKTDEPIPTREQHKEIIRQIDMGELVNLTIQHNPIVSW